VVLDTCVNNNLGPGVLSSDRIRDPVKTNRSGFKKRNPMDFHSILYETPDDRGRPLGEPAFFVDLNCDQMVEAIIAEKVEYNLAHYFYDCLTRVDAIKYRHEVMRDLETPSLHEQVVRFAAKMREMREQLALAKKMRIKEQKQVWRLEAATTYCAATRQFADDLRGADLKSRGFIGFRNYLVNFVQSEAFLTLDSETQQLKADLATIEYCLLTRGASFTVRRYEGEADYSLEVEETFEKFKQGAAKDYRVKFSASVEMNHIEAKILEFVVKLYPDIFIALDMYSNRRADFSDPNIMTFDREVQFYVSYLDYIGVLERSGLSFCYPGVSERAKEIVTNDCFDIVLAQKLAKQNAMVVCNDFSLIAPERIIVVSGPNQGGKTTFARAFGQLHYLASVGCPVPARQARVLLCDQIFTHFEKEEKVENLRGKLEDDLIRIHKILSQVTSRSIIIMNEVFTSTTIRDETFLSEKIMEKIIKLNSPCVWVTFVDELASFGPQTVSMVSAVVPENPAMRTFKVVRRPADGLAYAMAIAQKHELTYESIRKRIKS
jgi:DNA mismatch repair protein MutS